MQLPFVVNVPRRGQNSVADIVSGNDIGNFIRVGIHAPHETNTGRCYHSGRSVDIVNPSGNGFDVCGDDCKNEIDIN